MVRQAHHPEQRRRNAFLPDSVFPTNLGTMSILFGPGRGSLRLVSGGRMVLDGGVWVEERRVLPREPRRIVLEPFGALW